MWVLTVFDIWLVDLCLFWHKILALACSVEIIRRPQISLMARVGNPLHVIYWLAVSTFSLFDNSNNLAVIVVDRINISTSNNALIFSQLHYLKRACLSILTML